MIITKMSLPRRTFLRGAGATLALPLLDAMTPALAKAAQSRLRLGFYYPPNGMYLPHFFPKTAGANFEISPILKPLEAFRDQMVLFGGLANRAADNNGEGGGPHTRLGASWLSGVRPKRTEGADYEAGTTIDQMAAAKLGNDTPLASLEVTLEQDFIVGNCDNGYACIYKDTFSWRTPTSPMPMEGNPRIVFERLFGEGGSGAERLAQFKRDRSVLDLVGDELARLQKRLGVRDRTTVAEYVDTIRDVEQRIQRAEKQSETSPVPVFARPSGIPDDVDEYAKLMLDLNLLAYQADVTRIVSFQIARELSSRSYPQIGVPDGHHTVSHHQSDPERVSRNTKINILHASWFAYLVDKMRKTTDGDGSLLDHAMLVYAAGMGDSDLHSPIDIPTILVGGACGMLKGGRYIRYESEVPRTNLWLTLLHKWGIDMERIGDSTGTISDI